MQQPSIHIRHLNASYRVTQQAADAAATQRRLDRVARERLSRQLENAFAGLGDDAFYFIREMTVEGALDLDWDDERVARGWAEAVRVALMRAIVRGGDSVKVFRRRAEYVAHFIEDLLGGAAWGRWYYRALAHLSALPHGEIIVRVLTEEADAGRDAMLELARRGELDPLLSALGDVEVERVVEACLLPQSRCVFLPQMAGPWAEALRAALKATPLSGNLARDVARLYLDIWRRSPELGPDVNLARFIRDVLDLRLAVVASKQPRGLLRFLEAGDWMKAARLMSEGGGRELLTRLARELGAPEVSALLRDLQVEAQAAVTLSITSRYGGLFLLAPFIEEMGLPEFLQGCAFTEAAFAPKGGLLLYVACLQCLGLENGKEAAGDRGLLFLSGLERAPAPFEVRQYAENLSEDAHDSFRAECEAFERGRARAFVRGAEESTWPREEDARWFALRGEDEAGERERAFDEALARVSRMLLREFAARLGAFAASSPQYLSRNFLECRAEILVSAGNVAVRFLTCPLQMVLRMAGFDHRTWSLSWLGRRRLEFRFE
jgi:hypothetical protein